MSSYKRIYISDHYYFFTAVTHKRTPIFKSPDHVQLLRDAFRYVKERRSFDLLAASVMPDHIHCIWRMPEGDSNYSVRWQMLKTAFSRKIRKKHPGKKVWQPRFWEHVIRNEKDLIRHLDYIHYNPVKHGLCRSPCDWQYSSFQRYLKAGFYEPDWGLEYPSSISEMDLE